MLRFRKNKPLVLLGVALIACAALLPFAPFTFVAVLTPLWTVVAAVVVTIVRRRAVRCDEQLLPLLTTVSGRAPPALPVAV